MASAAAYQPLHDNNYTTFLNFNFEDKSKRLAIEKTTVNGKKHKALIVVDLKEIKTFDDRDDLKKVVKFVQDHQVHWHKVHKKTRVQLERQTAHLERISVEYNQKIHLTKIQAVYYMWKLKVIVHCKNQNPITYDFNFDRLSTNEAISKCVDYASKQKITISYKGTSVSIIPAVLYKQQKCEGFEKGLALELPNEAWLKDNEPGKDREIQLHYQKINHLALVRFSYDDGYQAGWKNGYDEGFRRAPRPVSLM